MGRSGFKIALVQMAIGSNTKDNLERAAKQVSEAKSKGATLVVLPECFNSPYGTEYFPKYAEEIPTGPSSLAMSKMAKDNGIFLVGGSIPEKENGRYYNTCAVWDPKGNHIASHRKVHLFNMDIPGKCTFRESDVFTPGNTATVFDMGTCKVGVGICYDLRFGEWATLFKDVDLIIYPGAFDVFTGPMHWDLLLRARALDNQAFVAGVCGARDTSADYVAWGHSLLADPWGRIVMEADEKETILYHDIDFKVLDDIRKQIPVKNQKRRDLYETKSL